MNKALYTKPGALHVWVPSLLTMSTATAGTARRRRGAMKSSLTKLIVGELEGKLNKAGTLDLRILHVMLEKIDTDFKARHLIEFLNILEKAEDEEAVEEEQKVLDSHENQVATLTLRLSIYKLIDSCGSISLDSSQHKVGYSPTLTPEEVPADTLIRSYLGQEGPLPAAATPGESW